MPTFVAHLRGRSRPRWHGQTKNKLYYDVLGDNRSAISEFLIPLMYRGDIGCVNWVRPQWQEVGLNDTGDEHFDFDVGFDKYNQPSVNISCLYYLEEGSYSSEPLREKRRVSVRTCHAESLCKVRNQSIDKKIEPVPWILDVCLDYQHFKPLSARSGAWPSS